MSKYFALNESDIEFDNTIRESIKNTKSKSHMALYLQGQEELNLLRELVQRQRDMSEDLDILHTLLQKYHELEFYDHKFDTDEAYLQIFDELACINRSIQELMEYICESDEDNLENLTTEQQSIVKDATSLVRLNAAKAARNYSKSLSKDDKHLVLLWDYILCAMKFVSGLYD